MDKTLIRLNLLPLIYVLEFHDIMLLIMSLKDSTHSFNIYSYVHFNNQHTRPSSSKL